MQILEIVEKVDGANHSHSLISRGGLAGTQRNWEEASKLDGNVFNLAYT